MVGSSAWCAPGNNELSILCMNASKGHAKQPILSTTVSQNGALSGPALTLLVSLDTERLTPRKGNAVVEIIREQDCHILLLQETHRDQEQIRHRINGMTVMIIYSRQNSKEIEIINCKWHTTVINESISESRNRSIALGD